MTATILPCPFCGEADVEIGEPEPGVIAIDCPSCLCIGPYGDTLDEAIERWNFPHTQNLSLAREVEKINAWDAAGRPSA